MLLVALLLRVLLGVGEAVMLMVFEVLGVRSIVKLTLMVRDTEIEGVVLLVLV